MVRSILSSSFYTMLMLLASRQAHGFGGVSMTPLLSTRTTTTITSTTTSTTTTLYGATTVEPPVREKTDRKTGSPQRRGNQQDDDDMQDNNDDSNKGGDLEYLIDPTESREMNDPFHILLLGSTFDKPKITVPYCAGSLEYVLNMPNTEATELSAAAEESGLSCLGTWPREECLSLGKQLQVRDLVCRVVPYVQGGQRGWQAKDASDANYSNAGGSSDSDFN